MHKIDLIEFPLAIRLVSDTQAEWKSVEVDVCADLSFSRKRSTDGHLELLAAGA